MLFTACNAQTNIVKGYETDKSTIKDSLMFEKFNFDLFNSKYSNFKKENGYIKLSDGTLFEAFKSSEDIYNFVIPPSPLFYTLIFYYYQNGNLLSKGKKAGFNDLVKIGKWCYYDENGKLTKEIDEEKKFGLWGFNKVLDVLDKDKVINLETGKNRDADKLSFNFKKETKIWTVKVFKKLKSKMVDEYYEYLFDGNTGKYTRNLYERYNINAADMPDLPPLKNSKTNVLKRKNGE
ncbi:hypothetical protein CMT52_08730 [Elizabethkingia anophelis]|nr:hypothetical protein [Elizabethkingia anophelis]